MKYLTTILIILLFASCASKKVIEDKTKVVKQTESAQETGTKTDETVKTVDKTAETTNRSTEAKNAFKSNAGFEADSIIIERPAAEHAIAKISDIAAQKIASSAYRIKIYPKGPIIYNTESEFKTGMMEVINKQNDIVKEEQKKQEQYDKSQNQAKTDSLSTHKNTEVSGSGKVWAKYTVIGAVFVIVIGLLLLYLRTK